jgi:hypothetical protein
MDGMGRAASMEGVAHLHRKREGLCNAVDRPRMLVQVQDVTEVTWPQVTPRVARVLEKYLFWEVINVIIEFPKMVVD